MGSLAVLEAVITASIMLTAVAYVSTFEQHASVHDAARSIIDVQLEDFLRNADATPATRACSGNTMLEQLTIDGVTGNDSEWQARAERYFAPGTETGMYLTTPDGRNVLLHGDESAVGESRSTFFMPDFSGAGLITHTPVLGQGDPLKASAAAVRHSELVRMKGDAMRLTLSEQDAEGSVHSHLIWAPTALFDNETDGGRVGVVNISWSFDKLTPTNALDVQATSLDSPMNLYLLLGGGSTPSGAVIPKDATVEVVFPSGWIVPSQARSHWHEDRSDLGPAGTQLVLRATEALHAGDSILLSAQIPATPSSPFDVIRAYSSLGTFSEANLVVSFPPTSSTELPREIYPITPYGLRPGESSLFGVSFANGGGPTSITKLDIEIPGGYDIFKNDGKGAQLFTEPESLIAAADGVTQSSDWHVVDSRHVQWRGAPINVDALHAAWLGAWIPITHWSNQSTSVEPPGSTGVVGNVTIANDDGTSTTFSSSRWGKSPGITEVSIPPMSGVDANDGYDVRHTALSGRVGSNYEHVDATGAFTVSAAAGLLALNNAVKNSSFTVRDRLVPTGSMLRADGDVQSLVSELGKAGVSEATIQVDLYAPPQFQCIPSHSWNFSTLTMPRARIGSMLAIDPLGSGVQDLVVATGDQNVYRLDAAARQVWRSDIASLGTAMAWSDPGGGLLNHQAILVGDANGNVHALDAATGVPSWSTCVALSCTGGGNVTSIAVRTSPSFLIATTTGDGRACTLDALGRIVACVNTYDPASDVSFAPDGDRILFLTHNHGATVQSGILWSYTDALASPMSHDGNGDILAYAYENGPTSLSTEPTIRIAQTEGFHAMLASDLSWIGYRYREDSQLTMAASGDLDGDGFPELAAVAENGDLIRFGGVDDTRIRYELTRFGETPKGADQAASQVYHLCDRLVEVRTFKDMDSGATYQVGATCPAANQVTTIAHVTIGPSGIGYTYNYNGQNQLAVISPSGHIDVELLGDNHLVTAATATTWGTTRGILVGFDDGLLRAFDSNGVKWQETSPSGVVGRFTFTTQLPDAGFYGTNILIVTLTWVDPHTQAAQSARLVDWFELVGVDGRPVADQAYHVSLVGRDAGER